MQSVADKLFASAQLERARSRDQELLRYVGRHGIVSIAHVMETMGVGRTAAYRRVATCAEAGLLERIEVLRSEPTLLRATRDGLAYAGLPFPVAEISPATVTHSLRCVSAAQVLCEQHGSEHVLTEREIVYAERIEDRRSPAPRSGSCQAEPRASTAPTSRSSRTARSSPSRSS